LFVFGDALSIRLTVCTVLFLRFIATSISKYDRCQIKKFIILNQAEKYDSKFLCNWQMKEKLDFFVI
jgi:hypothetical protein